MACKKGHSNPLGENWTFFETLCAVLVALVQKDAFRGLLNRADKQKVFLSRGFQKSSACLVYWKKSQKAYGFSLETLWINNRGIHVNEEYWHTQLGINWLRINLWKNISIKAEDKAFYLSFISHSTLLQKSQPSSWYPLYLVPCTSKNLGYWKFTVKQHGKEQYSSQEFPIKWI